jgi:hypothetical protein
MFNAAFGPVQDSRRGRPAGQTIGPMKLTMKIAMAVAADLCVVLGLTAVAATIAATPAHAAASTGAGYVWANNSTSASYTPSASYNFNSTDPLDAINSITRTVDAVGPRYTVRFPDLGLLGGTVHVTGYGASSTSCQVQSWGPSGDDQLVHVRCFNDAGTAVNSQFTVAYTNVEDSEDGVLGYAWANNSAATLHTPYVPTSTYQANSAGGTNTVTRVSTGVYSVHMPGLGNPSSSHVQVTPYGSTAARCVTPGWGYNAAGNAQDATVRCYSMAGAPVNTRFTVTIAAQTNILGLGNCCDPAGIPSAYALVFTPVVNGEFDIWQPREFATFPFGAPVGNRLGVGAYTVNWYPYVPHDRGNVQVTAYSGTAVNCKVVFWSNAGGIRVQCYDTDGDPVDSTFTLAFTGPYTIAIP